MKKTMRLIFTVSLCVCLASTCVLPFSAFAASESDLRSSVVSIASGEVGYSGTSTKSKYGEWYGYQGGWCTTFVLWCFNKAGEAAGITLNGVIIPRGGNCNSMISWFENKGRYKSPSEYTPSAGDLVFFDWNDNGSCDHVGIVNYTSGSTVYTIEGNCSGKVKSREYTSNGKKPYNNISAIMGYASVDYSSVCSAASTTEKKTTKKQTTKKQTTTKKKTTKKQTTKKQTTKKQTTTKKKNTEKKTTKKQTTKKETTTQKTTASTTTEKQTTSEQTTTEQTTSQPLTALSINASTYDLQVGDTISLEYSVEPSNATAVVGYFCDEDSVIEIGTGGKITAVGAGTATVVVCANNDLYAQCDFTVTEAVGEVSEVAQDTTRKVVETNVLTSSTQQDAQSVLTKMGVNVSALSQNKQLFIIPLSIIGVTAAVSVFIFIIKKIKMKKK